MTLTNISLYDIFIIYMGGDFTYTFREIIEKLHVVDTGVALFVGIIAFTIIAARGFGSFAASATMRFSGGILRLVFYGILTYFFLQNTLDKPIDTITLFTIAVCCIELLVNCMDLILFCIEPFIKKNNSLDI